MTKFHGQCVHGICLLDALPGVTMCARHYSAPGEWPTAPPACPEPCTRTHSELSQPEYDALVRDAMLWRTRDAAPAPVGPDAELIAEAGKAIDSLSNYDEAYAHSVAELIDNMRARIAELAQTVEQAKQLHEGLRLTADRAIEQRVQAEAAAAAAQEDAGRGRVYTPCPKHVGQPYTHILMAMPPPITVCALCGEYERAQKARK